MNKKWFWSYLYLPNSGDLWKKFDCTLSSSVKAVPDSLRVCFFHRMGVIYKTGSPVKTFFMSTPLQITNWTVTESFPPKSQWHLGNLRYDAKYATLMLAAVFLRVFSQYELHQSMGAAGPYISWQHAWTACPVEQHLLTGWGRSLLFWIRQGEGLAAQSGSANHL